MKIPVLAGRLPVLSMKAAAGGAASALVTRLIWLLGALLALLAMQAAPASAEKTDRILVANGPEIIGEVKGLEHGRLRVSTDYMRTVEVDWEQVLRVQSKLEFEVETLEGERYFGQLAASEEHRILVVATKQDSVRLPFAEILVINQTKSTERGKIDASVSIGFSFTQATDVTQASLDGDYSQRTPRFSRRFSLVAILSDTAEETFSRGELSFRLFRHLPGRWTWQGAASLQGNEQLGLDRRLIATASAQHLTVRTAIRELWLGAGLAASRERFIGAEPSDTSLEASLSLRYFAFHFDDPELEVTVSLELYPGLSAWGRLRAELNLDLRRELVDDLFLGFDFYGSFDNQPTGFGAKREDIAVVASLGWSL